MQECTVTGGRPYKIQRSAGSDFRRTTFAVRVRRVQRESGRAGRKKAQVHAIGAPVGVVRRSLRDHPDVGGVVCEDHGFDAGGAVDDPQVDAVVR